MTLKQAHSGLGAVSQFSDIVMQASQTYGVPANLINSVIMAESSGNPNAVSPMGAVGLMQLEPGTAAGLGVTNSYDPTQNINGGTQYLSQLLSQFNGDIPTALAAYNFGPGAVASGKSWPTETVNYVNKILGMLGLSSTNSNSNVPSVDISSVDSSFSSDSGFGDLTTLALLGGGILVSWLLLRDLL